MNYPLQKYYSKIYKNYDLVNRIFTFRMDEAWRKTAVKKCLENNPDNVLDLCCGTGDLAIRLFDESKYPINITGYDFSEPMLDVAKKKCAKKGISSIKFIYGEVAKMSFHNEQFDAIGITFGFRNLTYENSLKDRHLAEIFRVLNTGGRFVIVESNVPRNTMIRKFYNLYLNFVVKPVGGLISRDFEAYKYLTRSSNNFFNPEEIIQMLKKTGFTKVEYKSLFFGAAGLFTAQK
ncbi:MAG: bifunctional demethylmenaquinone methyltransferase/2-methoxy-6-polyprenyl-1,4-benzoquinol methylase UbiE [Bacteroidales bacterium]|nr:bifunctional demethylmenaquinone methyltransferase/2-methoxy-6-polyprenyl-1,4-benzoquinol methylase UbiE [Bacteroidales bacterium]